METSAVFISLFDTSYSTYHITSVHHYKFENTNRAGVSLEYRVWDNTTQIAVQITISEQHLYHSGISEAIADAHPERRAWLHACLGTRGRQASTQQHPI